MSSLALRDGGAATCRKGLLLAVLIGLWVSPARAHGRELPAQPVFELLTIGPGDDLFSLWGHSVICRHSGDLEVGVCYDFGVSVEPDPVALAVGTLRGRRLFRVTRIPSSALLEASRFRELKRQVLPLAPEQAASLGASLEQSFQAGLSYAYQPVRDNCSTRLRDALDGATSGRLRGQPRPTQSSLRDFSERGLSGRVLLLIATELAAGSRLDGPAAAWDRMAFPEGLAREIELRLSAPISVVHRAAVSRPKTSVHAGRWVLGLLCLVSAIGLLRLRGWQFRVLAGTLGALLSIVAFLPWVGASSTLPSLHGNWQLAVLWVSDFVLAVDNRRWLLWYARLRLGLAVLLGASSALGVIAQPLVLTSACVALIWGAFLLRARRAR